MDIYGNTNEKNLNIVSVLRIFLFNLKSCLLCGLHGKEFGSLCNKSLPIQPEAHTEFLVGAGLQPENPSDDTELFIRNWGPRQCICL